MANSRKSLRRNKSDNLSSRFERALDAILARVCLSRPKSVPVVAIAYSGGLDSTVLLHFAQKFCKIRAIPLHALHIHHGLSVNADSWLQHCQKQALEWDIPFQAARVQLDANDPHGVEDAARRARYQTLGALCQQLDVTVLLTGHHQHDQAETVFLQMMRGAGLPGLSAMPLLQERSELLGNGTALARPLLDVARPLLEQTAQRLRLAYVDDESNADARYRRNGVRHAVFPILQGEFPGFASRLARVASHMQSAQRLLDEVALTDFALCGIGDKTEALDISAIKRLSADRISNLLRHWLYRHGVPLPSATRLEEIRWQMLEAGADMHPYFEFGPMQLHRIKNRLELHFVPAAAPFCSVRLQWHDQPVIDVPEWNGRLIFEKATGLGIACERLQAGPLEIRARSGSERFKPMLNRPSKSLKQLFQEQAIPSCQRPRLPLLYLGEQLVFVAGLGINVAAELTNPGIALRWQPTRMDPPVYRREIWPHPE
jgi:tRNA(Ile)-lysidine synthase